MVSIDAFREMALSFPDVIEQPHFDLPSFRVKGKIFATLWVKDNRGMLRLPVVEQSVYCDYDNTIFFPVPGGWGLQGATLVELKKVKKTVLKEAMAIAYKAIASKK
jgi:hypothetical protein